MIFGRLICNSERIETESNDVQNIVLSAGYRQYSLGARLCITHIYRSKVPVEIFDSNTIAV